MAFYSNQMAEGREQEEFQRGETLELVDYRLRQPAAAAIPDHRLLPLNVIGFPDNRLQAERSQIIGGRLHQESLDFAHYPQSESMSHTNQMLGLSQAEVAEFLEQRMRHEAAHIAVVRHRLQMEESRLCQEALTLVEHRLRIEGMHVMDSERLRQEAMAFVEHRLRQEGVKLIRQEGVELIRDTLLQEVLMLLEHRMRQDQMQAGNQRLHQLCAETAGSFRVQQEALRLQREDFPIAEDKILCGSSEMDEGVVSQRECNVYAYGERGLPILELSDRRMHLGQGYADHRMQEKQQNYEDHSFYQPMSLDVRGDRVTPAETFPRHTVQNQRLQELEEQRMQVKEEEPEDMTYRFQSGRSEMEEQELSSQDNEDYSQATREPESSEIGRGRFSQGDEQFAEVGMQNENLVLSNQRLDINNYQQPEYHSEALGLQEDNLSCQNEMHEGVVANGVEMGEEVMQEGEHPEERTLQQVNSVTENRSQPEDRQSEEVPRSNQPIPPQIRKAILAILMAVLAVLMMLVHHLQQQQPRRWEDSLSDLYSLETDDLMVAAMLQVNQIQSLANSLSAEFEFENDDQFEEEYGSDYESDA